MIGIGEIGLVIFCQETGELAQKLLNFGSWGNQILKSLEGNLLYISIQRKCQQLSFISYLSAKTQLSITQKLRGPGQNDIGCHNFPLPVETK